MQARKGEADTTPDDILSMVKAQAQPPHRQAALLAWQSLDKLQHDAAMNMCSTSCVSLQSRAGKLTGLAAAG